MKCRKKEAYLTLRGKLFVTRPVEAVNLSVCTVLQVEKFGKISAQPHTTLCIQFLDRENNDKNNTFPLGKQICFTIVWGCTETLPYQFVKYFFCFLESTG